MVEEFYLQQDDGIEIYAQKWLAENPRAVLQIAHGMAEHIQRYDEFAKMLVSHGISVYGNDHRGHGETAKRNGVAGYFAGDDGFQRVTKDMETLTSLIEKENPGLPIFLFGHSMGSFLSRRYIQLYGDRLSGVILSGTGGNPGLLGKVGGFLARREGKRNGETTPSPLMNRLVFGTYNKAFRPSRTEFDWLSRDEAVVDKYIEDPDCGNVFTAGFFQDLLKGLDTIHRPEYVAQTPIHLPIYLISGSDDPVGNNKKGVQAVYEQYTSIGMKDVTCQFYEGARHELLNESNKEEVFTDIVNWLEKHI